MNSLALWWEHCQTQYAQRTAVVGSGQRATYGELNTAIQSSAQTLKGIGVGPGIKVTLVFANEPRFLVAFFAVLTAGGIPCPLNPNLTTAELDSLLQVLEPHLALASQLSTTLQSYLQTKLPVLNLTDWTLNVDEIQLEGVAIAPHESTPDPELAEVACIFCTSGTTGLPKAVLLTHQNLLSNTEALWAHKKWLELEIFGNALPVFHIYGLTVLTLLPLSMGGTVVYMPKFSPQSCLQTIEQERITRFGGVPSMFAMLNQYRQRTDFDVSCCQSWISGGAPLPESAVEEFSANYAALIYEGYGMLETSPGMSWNLDDAPYRKAAVGRPLKGVAVRIRDSDGQNLSQGETGQIWVSGSGVMKGYYRNPTATAETIQNGWLDTGDIGRFDVDGYLYLMGRQKEVMIVGGHNVYPREIETVLLSHPAIADAAVASQMNGTRGDEIFAFVVLSSQVQLDESALNQHCRHTLSSFKLPRHIYAVDQIPRNDSGKILRKALLAQVQYLSSRPARP
jgi:long-chain acyl-CoA synthetase